MKVYYFWMSFTGDEGRESYGVYTDLKGALNLFKQNEDTDGVFDMYIREYEIDKPKTAADVTNLLNNAAFAKKITTIKKREV